MLGSCALPTTLEALDDRNPPPEFGRPGWVRVAAGTGAWIGGIAGGVLSIALLPVTWPISKLAGDGLGEQAASEFMLFPALGTAAIGHCLLGVPTDTLDYVFRRVWTGSGEEVENSYEVVPMPAASVPVGP